MRFRLVCFAFSLICASSISIAAADDKWKVETLPSDLSAPNGLAIQPGTEDVFVSEGGAGRVIVVSPAKPDAYTVAVEGFPRSENPKNDNTAVRSGLAGLGFLNEQVLAVAFSRANHKPALGVYQLPAREDKDAKPVHFDAAKQILGSPEAGAQSQNAGDASLGNYFAVTVSPFSPPALFLTNPGSNRGWLFRADIRSHSSLEELKPIIPTKVTPLAITVNRRGILVVVTSAEQGKALESTISFYNTKTNAVIASYSAPLGDILSLAYSPASGRLYAASSSRARPADAGIYRLDGATVENRAGMKVVRIAAIDRPTGLAFTVGNSLYATALGAAGAEAKADPSAKGSLIRITGDL